MFPSTQPETANILWMAYACSGAVASRGKEREEGGHHAAKSRLSKSRIHGGAWIVTQSWQLVRTPSGWQPVILFGRYYSNLINKSLLKGLFNDYWVTILCTPFQKVSAKTVKAAHEGLLIFIPLNQKYLWSLCYLQSSWFYAMCHVQKCSTCVSAYMPEPSKGCVKCLTFLTAEKLQIVRQSHSLGFFFSFLAPALRRLS